MTLYCCAQRYDECWNQKNSGCHILPYIIGVIIFALLCAIYGYVMFRGKDIADSRYKIVVASIFSAPLLLFLLVRIGLQIADWLKFDLPVGDSTFLILFYGQIAVISPIGGIYYVLTAVFIALAWFAGVKSRSHKMALGIDTSVLLLYVGYITWWYVTGQQMTFP